jgi:catechol-2,3-dioxygenase
MDRCLEESAATIRKHLHPPRAVRAVGSAARTVNGSPPSYLFHGVSEAIYLRDPDENSLELYWDRPPEHQMEQAFDYYFFLPYVTR